MKRFTSLALLAAMFMSCTIQIVSAAVEVVYNSYVANKIVNTNKYANTDYTFTIGSETFTMLDIFDDEASAYLVVANQNYGNRTINGSDFGKEPDIENNKQDENITYWLNNTFTVSGNGGKTLNRGIIKHIDFEHLWTGEAAPKAKIPIAETYIFKAGITLPAVSEMEAYKDMMGYSDTGATFLTRTPANQVISGGDEWVFACTPSNGKSDTTWQLAHWKIPANTGIRPMFYLDCGFFGDVAVDLETAGEAVKDEIKKVDDEKLLNLYSISQLIAELGFKPPEGFIFLENVKIKTRNGKAVTYGSTLQPSFDYSEDNRHDFKGAEYVWERIDGDKITVVGNGSEYAVTEADANGGQIQIRYKMTVTDTSGAQASYTSKAETIPALGIKSYAPNVALTVKKDTPTEHKFKLDGKSFQILDYFDNDQSTFFVKSVESYGSMTISSVYMNPTDQSNFAYTLNTKFPESGNSGLFLPAAIIDHIDFNHLWLTEKAPLNENLNVRENHYAFKAGITLISFSEIERYIQTVGDLSGFSRTPADFSNTTRKEFIHNIGVREGSIFANHWDLPAANQIKPVFYLKKDFFVNVKLDWKEVGEAIISRLTEMYTIEDFNGMYTDSELRGLGFKNNFDIEALVSSMDGTAAPSISGTIKSNLNSEECGVLIFVVYNKDGAALTSTATEVTLSPGQTKQFQLTASALPVGSYSAKLMFWEDFIGMDAKIRHISY